MPFGIYHHSSWDNPAEAGPVNPLPPNKMVLETGDAGRDGYTVISRADRMTGYRALNLTPVIEGPNLLED